VTDAPSRTRIATNLAALNVGWFLSILGAAHGMPWLGPWVVASLLGLHLALSPARTRMVEGALPLVAAFVGYLGDSALVLSGVLHFPGEAWLVPPTRFWMVTLWMNFATALTTSLYWLAGRPGLGMVLGALGAPPAYLSGAELGAVALGGKPGWALSLIAVEWGLAMPVLLQLHDWCGRGLRQRAPGLEPGGTE